eukprot:CAMPEP_0206436218 /NCGR_PEP_ID=MMETSP0324_2-20121206/10354_1 /ASSEMBLY_ACC=CAM_ASM_000836 /TAXON_ID=2866 /ORGANISM="Crypthecodinium cohnii, Strain Seligo" /LENGTH=374 /DNA_ID=CAMNT_0053903345 /DNA_START=163 /DNA_END=1284 /DNA_ORIENTATION=+
MSFEFLKSEWGIDLKPHGQTEIQSYAESTGKNHVKDYIKDADIRKLGVISSLPKDLARSPPSTVPPGQYLVQVIKIVDITQPARFQEDFEGGKWRLLNIELTDGEQKFKALEYVSVKNVGVHLPPGTKLLLWSTKEAPLKIRNAHLLLTPDTVEVLGGNVEKLVDSWKASKEVETNRLLWRTEGIKKTDKEDAAPPWTDFDIKKAPRVGGRESVIEAERAEWRKMGSSAHKEQASAAKEDGPTRAEVGAFQNEGQVKSQVASSAFAAAAPQGKGKGKSKSKEDGGGGKRGRRGNDWDDAGGEEKRAPVLGSTLASFIKSKDGATADEALAAFPDKAADAGGDWDAAWDAGGWGGGGGGGWSGGGGGWSAGSWGG